MADEFHLENEPSSDEPVHIFSSLVEAREFVKQEEILSCSRYIMMKRRKKNITLTDIESVENYYVKFEDLHGELPVQFDGVPFIHMGSEVWECHQGTDRKRKRNMSMKSEKDHDYTTGKKGRLSSSKKIGCNARVKIRMLIRFPTFKMTRPDSPFERRKISSSLRSALLGEMDKELRVLLRFCGQHHHKEAGNLQTLDSSVTAKIKELVIENGLRSSKEIKEHLDLYLRTTMLHRPLTSRRFNPSLQDIRNHKFLALRSVKNNTASDVTRSAEQNKRKGQDTMTITNAKHKRRLSKGRKTRGSQEEVLSAGDWELKCSVAGIPGVTDAFLASDHYTASLPNEQAFLSLRNSNKAARVAIAEEIVCTEPFCNDDGLDDFECGGDTRISKKPKVDCSRDPFDLIRHQISQQNILLKNLNDNVIRLNASVNTLTNVVVHLTAGISQDVPPHV